MIAIMGATLGKILSVAEHSVCLTSFGPHDCDSMECFSSGGIRGMR